MSTIQIPLFVGTGKGSKRLVLAGHALIDAADQPKVTGHVWMLKKARHAKTCYAVSRRTINGRKTCTFMHRLILGLAENDPGEVDHKNGDGLHNTQENLRVVSHGRNLMNLQLRADSQTAYKGVSAHWASGRFSVRISRNRVSTHLGLHPTAVEAAYAYNTAAEVLFGPHAWFNPLPENEPTPDHRVVIAAAVRTTLAAYRPTPTLPVLPVAR